MVALLWIVGDVVAFDLLLLVAFGCSPLVLSVLSTQAPSSESQTLPFGARPGGRFRSFHSASGVALSLTI